MSNVGISSPYRRGLFSNIGQDLAAASLEFTGTVLFLFLGLGGIQASGASNLLHGDSSTNGVVSNVPSIPHLMYIATSMGLSLLVSAWGFYRVTGAAFNPNISFALLLVGAITPVRFVFYCIAQLVGSIAATALLYGLLPGPITVSCVPALGVTLAQATFIEMFITAALVFSVLMLATEKHAATPFAPVGIGLTLFAGHLFAVIYTGAAMNTARAFGPAVILGFETSHWVYWVGPSLGSLLAAAFYSSLKYFDYRVLTPGQDSEKLESLSPNEPTHHRKDSV